MTVTDQIVGNDIIALVTGGVLEAKDPAAIPPVISETSLPLDIEMALVTLELLEEFGKTVQFTIDSEGVYDQSESEFSEASPVYYAKKIVPPDKYDKEFVDGDLIRANDLQTGVAGDGLEFELTPGTLTRIHVTIDTEVFKIVKVQPIYSGEQVAIYMLQLRQ